MTTRIEKYIRSSDGYDIKKINDILLSTTAAASTIAILPVPILNVAGVIYAQVRMINKLAKVFDIEEEESYTKAIISAVVTSILAELTTEAIESLTISSKLESIIGEQLIRATIAGYLTTLIGEVYIRHFALGGKISSINIDSFINYTKEYISAEEISVTNVVSNVMQTTLSKAGVVL